MQCLHPQQIPKKKSLHCLCWAKKDWLVLEAFETPLYLPDVLVIYSEEAAALNSPSQVYIEKLDFGKDCKKLTPDFASLANKVTTPINFTMIKIRIYALKGISRNINSLNKLLSRNLLHKT